MTERLYYTDPYVTTFNAHIVERLTVDGRPALVLDRTAFYPTGGGQPFDRGRLNAVDVLEVMTRDSDGAVIHLLTEDILADTVQGEIDWPRRFDHMQHHTGQHILTQAFIAIAGTKTVGFHLGEDSVTIDLNQTPISPEAIIAAEDLANAIVTRDLPVRAWFPADEELAALALRKTPDVAGRLRVVAIGDFDTTACGGTHVARTGEIGLIKVVKTEKYKDMTRVEFRCGGRALRDYRRKHEVVSSLAAGFTVAVPELEQAVSRLKAENRQLRADLKVARDALLEAEADGLWTGAAIQQNLRLIRRAWTNRDLGEIRQIAALLIRRPRTIALLGLAGEKAQIVLARSADLPGPDMAAVLRRALDTLADSPGAGKGGGRPDFAQGGGVNADITAVEAALREAESSVLPG